MFRKLICLVVLFWSISGYAFETPGDLNSLKLWGHKYLGGWSIDKFSVNRTEKLNYFKQHDFSSLWIHHQDSMLGYTGSDYQRFYIHFIKIKKNNPFSFQYMVSGKTKTKNDIKEFVGNITVLHIYEMSNKAFNEPGEWQSDIDLRKTKRYFLMAEFNFREKDGEDISGTLGTFFYMINNKIFYDYLESYSDNYANNLFVGMRKNSKTNISIKCNFGNYRIPFSGDLDYGAAEFFPNKKYYIKGWENFAVATGTYEQNPSEKAKKARVLENTKWWK